MLVIGTLRQGLTASKSQLRKHNGVWRRDGGRFNTNITLVKQKPRIFFFNALTE